MYRDEDDKTEKEAGALGKVQGMGMNKNVAQNICYSLRLFLSVRLDYQ